MTRRDIDTSVNFSTLVEEYDKLPEFQWIEDPEAELDAESQPKQKKVFKEFYLPDEGLKEAVDLAIALGRPLLLQGEPGCGKTRLAYAVAYTLGLPLEESYVKSTSRAQDLLYTYDAVNRLYDAQLPPEERQRTRDIKNYIDLGPLGRAIKRAQLGRRSVVLIDEIDKADIDFPNDLLWELDRLEFRVTEASEMHFAVGDKPELRPIVFVTHNEEKALPAAFLRRCIFHYIEFPQSQALLQKILATQNIRNQPLSEKATEIILKIRDLDLTKRPGLSELLDWVGYLEAVNAPVEKLEELPKLGALIKDESDRKRVVEAFSKS
ncbi:MoxR family ATPase [Halomicronema sp. CCY15110]|uniref:AAA family ATPase n=1 Tax=Halomicronema sp. CCY15110 TaxID=2767773 RepID=UPI0019500AD4|nr:MoxR family ATPase [Halomicronema sp. CCY15110]